MSWAGTRRVVTEPEFMGYSGVAFYISTLCQDSLPSCTRVNTRHPPPKKSHPRYLWLDIETTCRAMIPNVRECFAAVLRETNSRRGDIINPDTLAWANTSLPAVWCIGTSRTQRWTFSLASRLMNKTSAWVRGLNFWIQEQKFLWIAGHSTLQKVFFFFLKKEKKKDGQLFEGRTLRDSWLSGGSVVVCPWWNWELKIKRDCLWEQISNGVSLLWWLSLAN